MKATLSDLRGALSAKSLRSAGTTWGWLVMTHPSIAASLTRLVLGGVARLARRRGARGRKRSLAVLRKIRPGMPTVTPAPHL